MKKVKLDIKIEVKLKVLDDGYHMTFTLITSAPKITLLQLQYLKKTISFGLIYWKDATYLSKLYKPNNIIKYINSNYVGNSKD